MMYGGNNPYPPQGYDQAGFNFGQQQNSYQQPPYQQQGSYYQQPGSQYQQPGSQYQQPGSHYQQGPYSPYQQNPYPPQGYQQGPLNPNYNQHSAYDLPPTTQSSYPQNHRISLTFDRPTSSSYDPHNKRPLSFNGFDNRPNSYAQPPYNGPGEPYLAVPYNGNPYPPYNGPGEPYLAVQYNGNQPYQQQPYNMPMINSAPVYYQPPPQYFKDVSIFFFLFVKSIKYNYIKVHI